MFGWSEYMTLQDAPDAKAENAKLAGGAAPTSTSCWRR